MVGTFDTYDEGKIKAIGANEIIKKPFDGNIFIEACRKLLDGFGHSDFELSQELVLPHRDDFFGDKTKTATVTVEDMWSINAPKTQEQDFVDDAVEDSTGPIEIQVETGSPLQAGMEDWGITVPGVIGQKNKFDQMELPPVISETSYSADHFFEDIEDNNTKKIEIQNDDEDFIGEETGSFLVPVDGHDGLLPTDDDLEYPDANAIISSLVDENKNKKDSNENYVAESTELFDRSGADALYGQDANVYTEEEMLQLEKEVDQDKTSEFWAVDSEEEKTDSKLQRDVNIEDALKEKLKPVIEEFVRKYCKEIVEKVAWEVIPDLAENLIKNELAKIGESLNKEN